MSENWVPVKFQDLKVGDKIKTHYSSSRFVYEILSITTTTVHVIGTATKNEYTWFKADARKYWKQGQEETQFKWVKTEFKDLQPGDEARFTDMLGKSDIAIIVSIETNGLIKVEYKSNGSHGTWRGAADLYEKKVLASQATTYIPTTNKQKHKPTDQWALLRSVFVPDADKSPKEISDHPHKCPFCGSKSYNHQVKIECTGNCTESQRTH